MPTVVPSNDSPLTYKSKLLFTILNLINWCLYFPQCIWTYMMSCALSCRSRGRSSLVLQSRKRFRVSVGFLSTLILSWSLQISKPSRATRTFSGR
uniref:Uncharacterized protein n=1 Tax=Sinocyclocheilus grahami TaxID=75366 RepID=A0A672L7A8_SINGR